QPPGPGESGGGDAVAPHRIEENAGTVDLDERRCVAVPGEVETALGRLGLAFHERDFAGGLAKLTVLAEEHLAEDVAQGRRGHRVARRGVAENPAVVLRGPAHAFGARPGGLRPERCREGPPCRDRPPHTAHSAEATDRSWKAAQLA